jgi:hypothetical protein
LGIISNLGYGVCPRNAKCEIVPLVDFLSKKTYSVSRIKISHLIGGYICFFAYLWFASLGALKEYALHHGVKIQGGWHDKA